MYINKVVFVEADDFNEDFRKFDDEFGIVQLTDYDTNEISADHIQILLDDLKDDEEKLDDFKQALIDSLGGDVFEALEKDQIDFCLVVY
jgi:hypothetical protein